MTADLEQRIAQFKNMAEADPDNDMAHFSLGSALLQAKRPAEAAQAFARCIALNPGMSKGYQLAGQAFLEAGDRALAIEALTQGYRVAAERGDRMPRDAMGELLNKIGAPVPQVAGATTAEATTTSPEKDGAFICRRTGRPGTQLPKPPFRGLLGQKIYETISQETWNAWIGQGTKVINELRLDLSRDEHARIYDQHMIEFLGLEDENAS